MSNLNAHKFGGSSLADSGSFKQVKSLLTGKNEIIIVSATKGTTQQLQYLLDLAKAGDAFEYGLENLKNQHCQLADELLNNPDPIKTIINKDCENIKNILQTVDISRDYAKSLQDLVLSFGELWSARIFADYLQATFLDAREVLVVVKDKVNNEEINNLGVDWPQSQKNLSSWQQQNPFQQLVITGFIATTTTGNCTTLGCNSSDYSASLFANLFQVKSLTIWTNVQGIYSADPARVKAAFPIEQLTYQCQSILQTHAHVKTL